MSMKQPYNHACFTSVVDNRRVIGHTLDHIKESVVEVVHTSHNGVEMVYTSQDGTHQGLNEHGIGVTIMAEGPGLLNMLKEALSCDDLYEAVDSMWNTSESVRGYLLMSDGKEVACVEGKGRKADTTYRYINESNVYSGGNVAGTQDVSRLMDSVLRHKELGSILKHAGPVLESLTTSRHCSTGSSGILIDPGAKTIKLDSGAYNEVRVSSDYKEGYTSKIGLEILNEANVRVKRRWTNNYPAIHINPDAAMRNKIVSHIGSKEMCRIPEQELLEFFNQLQEDETVGRVPNRNWLRDNTKLVEKVSVGSQSYYKLTKTGKRVYKHLNPETAVHGNTPGGPDNPDTAPPPNITPASVGE